jgi:hypothetical protein
MEGESESTKFFFSAEKSEPFPREKSYVEGGSKEMARQSIRILSAVHTFGKVLSSILARKY